MDLYSIQYTITNQSKRKNWYKRWGICCYNWNKYRKKNRIIFKVFATFKGVESVLFDYVQMTEELIEFIERRIYNGICIYGKNQKSKDF